MGLFLLTDSLKELLATECDAMSASAEQECEREPTDRQVWSDLLITVIHPEIGENRRRHARRYTTAGEVKLAYERAGRTVRRSFDVLGVSVDGIMARGHCEVDADELVNMEINLNGSPICLRGRVIHCTTGLGGYKIGIKLMFED
jgi:hypothetical protein